MATTELYPSSSGFSLPRATWHGLYKKIKKLKQKFYLAIRSQPDADVEDLVVVEEGEGEGAVHSPMSAVSNQKAPVLSNCKRIESESFYGNGSRFSALLIPFLKMRSDTFLNHLFSCFPVH